LPAPIVNGGGEEIAVENGRISNFEGLMTSTLTLDRVILHHSSTCTYTPNFIEIKQTFCGQTGEHMRRALLGRLFSNSEEST